MLFKKNNKWRKSDTSFRPKTIMTTSFKKYNICPTWCQSGCNSDQCDILNDKSGKPVLCVLFDDNDEIISSNCRHQVITTLDQICVIAIAGLLGNCCTG